MENYTANCIRMLRREAGLNQDVLARLLGVKRATYSHYETGRLHPSSEKLAKLADYYQVSLDTLCRLPQGAPAPDTDRPQKSRMQGITSEDLALLAVYHHLNGKEQKAVKRMMTEMAGG